MTTNSNASPQVFISYASEDSTVVEQLCEELQSRNVNVWFDRKNITGGRWKPQIIRALSKSRFFLLCITENTLRKLGDEPAFVETELSTAFEFAIQQDEKYFTIVPVRLEACERGDHRVTIWQQYDLFTNRDEALDKLALLFGGNALDGKKSSANSPKELSDDEQLVRGMLGKSDAFYHAKRYGEMLKLTAAAETLSENNKLILHDKGTALLNLGRLNDALQIFQSIVKLDPSDLEAWISVATTSGELGNAKDALNALDRALEIAPDNVIVWSNKATFLGGALGRYEDSLHAVEIALGLDPNNIHATATKGNVLAGLKRHREAAESFKDALALIKKISREDNRIHNLTHFQGQLYGNLGNSLLQCSKPNEALKAYNQALVLMPDNPHAIVGKLNTLMTLGKFKEAKN